MAKKKKRVRRTKMKANTQKPRVKKADRIRRSDEISRIRRGEFRQKQERDEQDIALGQVAKDLGMPRSLVEDNLRLLG